MTGGLFIALYDEDSLKLYLDKGVYGFLMTPVLTNKPSARSRHRNILADYACIRQRIKVFSFLKRKIICIEFRIVLYERLYNSPKTDTTTDESPRIKTYITAP